MTVTTQAPASHIGLEQIEAAREVIKGQVVPTPTIAAPKLSELTGAEVYIKCENLQFTNSFKDRGALGRDRHVGWQPCASRRLSRPPLGHPRHHRDAGAHAVREGGQYGSIRR